MGGVAPPALSRNVVSVCSPLACLASLGGCRRQKKLSTLFILTTVRLGCNMMSNTVTNTVTDTVMLSRHLGPSDGRV